MENQQHPQTSTKELVTLAWIYSRMPPLLPLRRPGDWLIEREYGVCDSSYITSAFSKSQKLSAVNDLYKIPFYDFQDVYQINKANF